MFERKKKTELGFLPPKSTTFGNDSSEEEVETEEIPDMGAFLKNMDKEIGKAKQSEKNATIPGVYSVNKLTGKRVRVANACGCFGS
jgi:hypothetical protein